MKNDNDHHEEGEDHLYEMASLSQNETGLPMIIWADVNRQGRHNSPLLKVSPSNSSNVHDGELVPVLQSESPRILATGQEEAVSPDDLRQVGRFVALNKEALLQYWNGDIDTGEFIGKLKKLA